MQTKTESKMEPIPVIELEDRYQHIHAIRIDRISSYYFTVNDDDEWEIRISLFGSDQCHILPLEDEDRLEEAVKSLKRFFTAI